MARNTAPPNVISKITLTNALVIKKAAFILLLEEFRIERPWQEVFHLNGLGFAV